MAKYFKTFRLKQNYFVLAAGTILKECMAGDYYVPFSDKDCVESGIWAFGISISGDVVENNPDIFEEIE